ncbi:hypothetical protein GGI21_000468 [Coemansia aciculifera]|nr:hypothetical protein GGI21_000468 [Coemansia aciculifera]
MPATAAGGAAPTPVHHVYTAPDMHHHHHHHQQQPPFYATSPYMLHQQQNPADAYSAAPRRLPSVSELLVSPGTSASAAQQQAVAAAHSASYAPTMYSPANIQQQQQKPFSIDVPLARSSAHHTSAAYAVPGHHRDSESASSVSSQATLLDSYSPSSSSHQRAFKEYDLRDQDEVYKAASILMSLRACKTPC